ncbi:MAG: Predicted integral membrane protein, partial [uncultured Acetobacteraceae bacterium]
EAPRRPAAGARRLGARGAAARPTGLGRGRGLVAGRRRGAGARGAGARPVHGAERAGLAVAAAAPRAPFPPDDDGDRLDTGIGERPAAGGAPGRRGGELPPAARGGRERGAGRGQPDAGRRLVHAEPARLRAARPRAAGRRRRKPGVGRPPARHRERPRARGGIRVSAAGRPARPRRRRAEPRGRGALRRAPVALRSDGPHDAAPVARAPRGPVVLRLAARRLDGRSAGDLGGGARHRRAPRRRGSAGDRGDGAGHRLRGFPHARRAGFAGGGLPRSRNAARPRPGGGGGPGGFAAAARPDRIPARLAVLGAGGAADRVGRHGGRHLAL